MRTSSFSVLPTITPAMTLALVIMGMTPSLVMTWRRPLPSIFPIAAVHACLTSFLLGFHVHEKAILMATVPLGLLAANCYAPQSPDGQLGNGHPQDTLSVKEKDDVRAAPTQAMYSTPAFSSPSAQPAAAPHRVGDGGDRNRKLRSGTRPGGAQAAEGLQQHESRMSSQSPSLLLDHLILATAGHYALLPLIFTLQEYPIKVGCGLHNLPLLPPLFPGSGTYGL